MATNILDKNCVTAEESRLVALIESASVKSPQQITKCVYCKKKNNLHCLRCFQRLKLHCRHSSKSECYNDKIETLHNKRKAAEELEKKCEKLLKNKEVAIDYAVKIRQSKERISLLQETLKTRNGKQFTLTNFLEGQIKENEKMRRNISSHMAKCEEIRQFIDRRHQQVDELTNSYKDAQKELEDVKKQMISELSFIFPITLIVHKNDNNGKEKEPTNINKQQPNNKLLSEEITDLLQAAQTSYHWIQNGWRNNLEYHIVSALLPGSGNYNVYKDYLAVLAAETKGDVKFAAAHKSRVKRAAHKIDAALLATAQLVVMLSYYLDIKLPLKLSLVEFSTVPKTMVQFSRRVARLNANILHLCTRQNSKIEYLVPNNPIHNILQLLDPSVTNLGRNEPVESKSENIKLYESLITDDVASSDESDSDEQWEAIPHVQCPEAPAGAVVTNSSEDGTQDATGGLVSNAAAGLFSFFRGFSSRR